MTAIMDVAGKLLSIILDILQHRYDTHQQILDRFDAAVNEAQGAMAELKKGFAANDAAAEQAIQDAMNKRG